MKIPDQEDFEEEKYTQTTKIESTFEPNLAKDAFNRSLSPDEDLDNETTTERLDSLEDEEGTIKEAFETLDPYSPYSEIEAWQAGKNTKLCVYKGRLYILGAYYGFLVPLILVFGIVIFAFITLYLSICVSSLAIKSTTFCTLIAFAASIAMTGFIDPGFWQPPKRSYRRQTDYFCSECDVSEEEAKKYKI